MKQIGEDIQDKLGCTPAKFYRERHIYPKYACNASQCQHQTLIQAPVPPGVIDKSIATPELLAHIIISKFADHLPLYRQSLIYQRSGVYLSDSTMADWGGTLWGTVRVFSQTLTYVADASADFACR